jgi:hypothetical protein
MQGKTPDVKHGPPLPEGPTTSITEFATTQPTTQRG